MDLINEFVEGENAYIVTFDIDLKQVSGIDIIDGVKKYWSIKDHE